MNKSIIENAVELARKTFAEDFSGHDYYHTERVYKLATKIATQENASVKICQLAALLHDVDDRKLSPETTENKDNARKFLAENGVEQSTIEHIVKIINEISFKGSDSVVPSSLDGKCVQDADRLDAIGALGIARAFAYGGSKHWAIYDPNQPPKLNMDGKEYYSQKDSSSINHFYEKLLLLKDMINTETAKKMAAKRDSFMRAFLDQFFSEWSAEE